MTNSSDKFTAHMFSVDGERDVFKADNDGRIRIIKARYGDLIRCADWIAKSTGKFRFVLARQDLSDSL